MSFTLNELKQLVTNELNESNLLLERDAYTQVVKALKGSRERIDTIGIMTAQNPKGEQAKPEFNKEQNKKLINYLRYLSLGHYHIGGKFAGVKEDSLIINNIDKETLMKLGKHFGQSAVIYGERISEDEVLFYYLDTESGESPTEPVSIILTEPDPKVTSREDMYSTVGKGKKKKKFVIPFFEDGYAHRKLETNERDIE